MELLNNSPHVIPAKAGIQNSLKPVSNEQSAKAISYEKLY
jgi:hypothetical protein